MAKGDIDPLNTTYLFTFEKTYDEDVFNEYMNIHYADSIIYSGVYVILIFGIQVFMNNRKRYELRPFLALWSGWLAVFSIIGTIRTLPEMIYVLRNYGFDHSVCNSSYMGKGKVTSLWTALFVSSKVFELGDTIFIVFRKQPLIFLHWYHHVTVLLYSWYSYPAMIATGRWFMVMNYLVHSLMYSYYAFRAMKYQFPKWVNMFITSLQLIQMIMGIVVNIASFYALEAGRDCQNSYRNIKYCLAMYFSYLVLFSHFFYTNYILKKPAVHHKTH